jgi:predicted AlkP superfamily phosphohydrolase/phosphomutase
VLAVAGYAAVKIGTPDIKKIKEAANQALDKIEPTITEIEAVAKEVKKAAPKNKTITKAANTIEAAAETVKKTRTKKQK